MHYEKQNACKIRFKKTSSPQIRRTRVPNLGRWIINKESTKNSYKIQKKKYKGYELRTKQCLSLTRLTNKIFLHTSTKFVRPSEKFRTSYPVLSIVVFRETTSTEHTISVLFLNFFRRIVSERKSCLNKFFVRWTRYFLCCSTTRIWL